MDRVRRTDEQWFSLIQECRTSGYTDREWCEQNQISINSFYNKVSQLRKKAYELPASQNIQPKKHQEVVPLMILDEQMESSNTVPPWDGSSHKRKVFSPSIALTLHGITMEIDNTASREVIQNVILALQQL